MLHKYNFDKLTNPHRHNSMQLHHAEDFAFLDVLE